MIQTILEKFYYHEINVELSSFWDGGWKVKIGDDTNGFMTERCCDSLNEAGEWLEGRLKKLLSLSDDPQLHTLRLDRYRAKHSGDDATVGAIDRAIRLLID